MTELIKDKARFDYLYNEIDKRESVNGITPIDMLSFPNSLSGLFDKIMRRNALSVDDAAVELTVAVDEAHQLMSMLVQKGYLREELNATELSYRIRFAAKRKRSLPPNLWEALKD